MSKLMKCCNAKQMNISLHRIWSCYFQHSSLCGERNMGIVGTVKGKEEGEERIARHLSYLSWTRRQGISFLFRSQERKSPRLNGICWHHTVLSALRLYRATQSWWVVTRPQSYLQLGEREDVKRTAEYQNITSVPFSLYKIFPLTKRFCLLSVALMGHIGGKQPSNSWNSFREPVS